MRARTAFAVLGLLSACVDLPRDPDGTLERVRAERSIRVGLAGPLDPAETRSARVLLDRVQAGTGAAPAIERAALEPLLARLEEGEVDMVLGRFAADTPWRTRVTLTVPLDDLAGRGGGSHLHAALRNGENQWITLVQREARGIAAPSSYPASSPPS